MQPFNCSTLCVCVCAFDTFNCPVEVWEWPSTLTLSSVIHWCSHSSQMQCLLHCKAFPQECTKNVHTRSHFSLFSVFFIFTFCRIFLPHAHSCYFLQFNRNSNDFTSLFTLFKTHENWNLQVCQLIWCCILPGDSILVYCARMLWI